jgi:hypothetical protein
MGHEYQYQPRCCRRLISQPSGRRDAPDARVRLAALDGLQRLGDPTLLQRSVAMLDDPDVQVQAATLALVLTTRGEPAYTRAQHQWEAMLDATDTATYIAALSVFPSVPETLLQGRLYQRPRAYGHRCALRCPPCRPCSRRSAASGWCRCGFTAGFGSR